MRESKTSGSLSHYSGLLEVLKGEAERGLDAGM